MDQGHRRVLRGDGRALLPPAARRELTSSRRSNHSLLCFNLQKSRQIIGTTISKREFPLRNYKVRNLPFFGIFRLAAVIDTPFVQLWKRPPWMTDKKSKTTRRLFVRTAVQAKSLSHWHRHRPRTSSPSWRTIRTWQRKKTSSCWKRKWPTLRFVFECANSQMRSSKIN